MNKNNDTFKRAQSLILGGTMLFSKKKELFHPEKWPTYFSKAKGINIWDLNNQKYSDMSLMGIGTNTLGYSNSEVNKEVIKGVNRGNISTLNCPEEVSLAERLIDLNPWADMIKFARTGGEANSIAIRISRVASGKDKVAICGYHGWHDWYLSANLNSKDDLSDHLMPGLEAHGVPKSLKDSVFPFKYNDLDGLKKIISIHDIGVIKMEVQRDIIPNNDFINSVRKLATEKNIVLIFDECTSGFRETFGGLYQKYNVNPDIVVYGKTLGNGFPITAVVGKKEIMETAQKTFISSTFWTERLGPIAALKTLEIMEREKSWEIISKLGEQMKNGWKKNAKKNNLEIEVRGLSALANFHFTENNLVFKTFLIQEFLNKNILGTNAFYPSIFHNDVLINKYLKIQDITFQKINHFVKKGINIEDLIVGKNLVLQSFKRLN